MMKRSTIQLVWRSVLIGLAAAFIVVWFKPELLPTHRPALRLSEGGSLALREVRAANPNAGAAAHHSYADAVARAAPAVVNVYTAKVVTERVHPLMQDPLFRHFFGDQLGTPRQRLQTSLGSGVIMSGDGYVLTNNHVISGADEIQVLLADGRSTQAKVVGTDPDTDLAVLRIALKDLPVITLGQDRTLRVGDVVLAIGNPFGVGQTVTHGIISALGRNRLGINAFENFIQTDAPINPGNSGGALTNTYGELIGINTAIFSRSGGSQGIGFAIPMSTAREVLQEIVAHGRVERGWLGVETQDMTPQLAESFGLGNPEGVLVAGVLRGGPGDQAGLRPGDILLRMDDRVVKNATEAVTVIAAHKPGSTLRLAIRRQSELLDLEAQVGSRPAAPSR